MCCWRVVNELAFSEDGIPSTCLCIHGVCISTPPRAHIHLTVSIRLAQHAENVRSGSSPSLPLSLSLSYRLGTSRGPRRRSFPRSLAHSLTRSLTPSVETSASRYNTRAIQLHDVINLGLIPVVALGTILGILGKVDPVLVSQGFLLYVLIDFVWLIVQPDAVPSLPNVILLHHVVTVVLLYFPLRYNELGIYTCIDGLCEINTFFLIARRQWPRLKDLMDLLYWLTFIPSRTICYPVGTC